MTMMRTLRTILLLFTFFLLAGCRQATDGFRFEEDEIELGIGVERDVVVLDRPPFYVRFRLAWQSADPDIASVDGEGTVRGTGLGTTSVTATDEDGRAVSCIVHVLPAVETVTIDGASLHLDVGDTFALSAVASPEGAYGSTVRWTSSNPDAVTVDQNGAGVCVEAGFAVVSAATQNGIEDSIRVFVSYPWNAHKVAETDQNSDLAHAQMLAMNGTTLFDASVSASDVDWYRIDIPLNTDISLSLFLIDAAMTPYVTLTLYNSSGTVLKTTTGLEGHSSIPFAYNPYGGTTFYFTVTATSGTSSDPIWFRLYYEFF